MLGDNGLFVVSFAVLIRGLPYYWDPRTPEAGLPAYASPDGAPHKRMAKASCSSRNKISKDEFWSGAVTPPVFPEYKGDGKARWGAGKAALCRYFFQVLLGHFSQKLQTAGKRGMQKECWLWRDGHRLVGT